MAKKYIRLNENGNLSQVVEFKDGDRMELPLTKEGKLLLMLEVLMLMVLLNQWLKIVKRKKTMWLALMTERKSNY